MNLTKGEALKKAFFPRLNGPGGGAEKEHLFGRGLRGGALEATFP